MGVIPDSMVSRLSAWHRTGSVLGRYFSYDEMITHVPELSQLVVKLQLSCDGQRIDAWGTFGADDNKFYGTVGAGYQVLQHTDGLKLADQLIGHGASHYETGGIMFGGAVVFATIALDKVLRVGDDKSHQYLNFFTSHNGMYPFTVRVSSVRMVCNNTVRLAMDEKMTHGFRVYHTKNAQLDFADASEAMKGVERGIENLEINLNFLAERMVSGQALTRVMQELFLKDSAGNAKQTTGSKRAETVFANRLEEIIARYEDNDDNAFPEQRGTAYNLLQAITGYVDHGKDRSFEYATLGQGDKLKSRALEVITLLADGMPSKTTKTRYALMEQPCPMMDNQAIVDELLAGR